jgi:hypothetical protein
MLIEVAIVAVQAARGTTSHFNVGAPLDAALFGIMGVAIFAQTLSTFAVAAALWRQRFEDRAMGWALRAGMTLTILGALVGGIMTSRPTAAQLEEARVTGRLSTVKGDLRVPHFFGLHAIQALPLFAILLRHRPRPQRASLVMAASVAYALLFAFLLNQALRGAPLVAFTAVVPEVEGGLR